MSGLPRAITAAAAGVGGKKTYFAFAHYNDSSSHNVSLYELDSGTLTKLSSIQARSGDSASYAVGVAFHPDPSTYGKYLAVTTSVGYSIIDYSDDTSLTEIDTGGSASKNLYGVAYNASGSNLFTTGSSVGYHYKYDVASDGTLSNETQSAYHGIGERIYSIALAKTKDVGMVVYAKGNSADIGAQSFTPSTNALDDSVVTSTEEVVQCDVSPDGTYGVFIGKDFVSHPKYSAGRINIDSSNNLSLGTQVIAGAAPIAIRIHPDGNYVAVGGNYSSGNKLRLYYASMGAEATSVDPGGTNPQLTWTDDGDYLISYVNATAIKVWSYNGSTSLSLESTISSNVPSIFSYVKMDSITA